MYADLSSKLLTMHIIVKKANYSFCEYVQWSPTQRYILLLLNWFYYKFIIKDLLFYINISGRYPQKVVEDSCPVTYENVPDNYQKYKSNDQTYLSFISKGRGHCPVMYRTFTKSKIKIKIRFIDQVTYKIQMI